MNRPNDNNFLRNQLPQNTKYVFALKRSFKDLHTIHGLWPCLHPQEDVAFYNSAPVDKIFGSDLASYAIAADSELGDYGCNNLQALLYDLWGHDWPNDAGEQCSPILYENDHLLWHHEYTKHGICMPLKSVAVDHSQRITSYFLQGLTLYHHYKHLVAGFDHECYRDKELHLFFDDNFELLDVSMITSDSRAV